MYLDVVNVIEVLPSESKASFVNGDAASTNELCGGAWDERNLAVGVDKGYKGPVVI